MFEVNIWDKLMLTKCYYENNKNELIKKSNERLKKIAEEIVADIEKEF